MSSELRWYSFAYVWDYNQSLVSLYEGGILRGTDPTGTPSARSDKSTIGGQYWSGTINNEANII